MFGQTLHASLKYVTITIFKGLQNGDSSIQYQDMMLNTILPMNSLPTDNHKMANSYNHESLGSSSGICGLE
mgnify:FL=1